MRHVGASPPAGSAAGASSLCSSSQTRAAAAKATTHPRSESGKSMRRSESKFEGCLIIQVTRFTHERQGRFPSLALALWWRSLSTLSGGGSVRRSLALSHARTHGRTHRHARTPGRADGGRSVSDDGGRDKNRILACVGRCILAPTAILGLRIILTSACAPGIISPNHLDRNGCVARS